MPIKSSSFVYAPVAPPGQKKNENNAFAAAFGDEQVPDFTEISFAPQLLMIQEAALEIF